jgi:hypothetical protein
MRLISHKEAKAAGLKRYFTGKKCARGHIAERLVSCRNCLQCHNEKCTAWAKRNRAKRRKFARAGYAANPDKQRLRCQAYYAANTARARARVSAWKRKHPDKNTANTARRNARKLKATPIWANHDAIEVLYSLARSASKQVDHIVPLKGRSVCGLHVHNNMQLLPPAENMKKGNRHV